jgi:hypothetical protein
LNFGRRDKSFLGQHLAQDFLKRHDMATYLPLGEEMAGTTPLSTGITQLMVVILSMEDSG